MKLATIAHDGGRGPGLVDPSGRSVTPLACASMLELIERAAEGQAFPQLAATALPLAQVRLCAPLPSPRRGLFCVGRNYRAHATELAGTVFRPGGEPEEWPIVFTKLAESVVGPTDDIELPIAISAQIDYEAELAVIISRRGRNIDRAHAREHIFGYTITNDVTARDVQMRHQQWDLGKSFDTFCPTGPWIVTADELDVSDIHVRCFVNGELRQDASTAQMIFDIPTLIETCSRGITLYPGDIICTGTPVGVGMGMKPPRFLSPGDVVRVEIDGIGAIQNAATVCRR
ncbi:MAG: fumarylacetoacetate hydrolase family protein [Burkholderiaceae bacterium]